ncbi:pentatricopeptide repeat-containing protein At5g11310, mitochondrial, partial [Syzygium oleosum]|uniref:pentatricopeptide repeat-containing protein At5g11310, mitochondrial n=1 Tax=Syzygium oleosum TaxID=219896 RepID=UPI0024B96AE6
NSENGPRRNPARSDAARDGRPPPLLRRRRPPSPLPDSPLRRRRRRRRRKRSRDPFPTALPLLPLPHGGEPRPSAPPPPPGPSAERAAPPHLIPVQPPPAGPSPDHGRGLDFPRDAFDAISDLFAEPGLAAGPALDSALDEAGVRPRNDLMEAIFARFDSSPKLLFGLFRWAEKQPEFRPSAGLFNSMINALGKARDFDAAWELINGRLRGNGEPVLVSADTFAIMIRRYARAGRTQLAIRTFEFASGLDFIQNADSEMKLLEILLDSLCKEGHVRVASDYLSYTRGSKSNWIPSIRVHNILLNGWLRSKNMECAEAFWAEMKKENVKPTVVTYGTLVEGYCRMQQVERAKELIDEMKREGIEPNAVVFNPIIDALAEAGRFEEALGMVERFLVCESGPTISTYNSLIKGFCKAGDLVGASRIIKMMISRGVVPTPTTYNYFFWYFSKSGKIEEGMNLYTKMIESGYTPDRLTYHLLLKLLCEEERLELAVQVSKEMKTRGLDMDLATSTMLIHLLCRMYKFEEAVLEFEDMIRRGVVPQYITFQRLKDELHKCGMTELACKLRDLMSSVPHSTNLPNMYCRQGGLLRARRTLIMQKAEAMSDIVKDCNNPRKLVKRRSSLASVSNSNELRTRG